MTKVYCIQFQNLVDTFCLSSKYAVGNSYNKVFKYIIEMKIGNTNI